MPNTKTITFKSLATTMTGKMRIRRIYLNGIGEKTGNEKKNAHWDDNSCRRNRHVGAPN